MTSGLPPNWDIESLSRQNAQRGVVSQTRMPPLPVKQQPVVKRASEYPEYPEVPEVSSKDTMEPMPKRKSPWILISIIAIVVLVILIVVVVAFFFLGGNSDSTEDNSEPVLRPRSNPANVVPEPDPDPEPIVSDTLDDVYSVLSNYLALILASNSIADLSSADMIAYNAIDLEDCLSLYNETVCLDSTKTLASEVQVYNRDDFSIHFEDEKQIVIFASFVELGSDDVYVYVTFVYNEGVGIWKIVSTDDYTVASLPSTVDTDGDGWIDFIEVLVGKDANDASSKVY